MKNIFAFLSLLILPLISVRAGDEDDVLRAERERALCYQNSDAAGIEQVVMEDYTLTNSKGKILRGLIIWRKRRNAIRNTRSLRITT